MFCLFHFLNFGIMRILRERDYVSNKNGQALVEFILIVPIFAFLIMTMIDFGILFTKQYQLQDDLDSIVTLYENRQSEEMKMYADQRGVSIQIHTEDNKVIFEASQQLRMQTPLLHIIFGNPYVITSKRVIFDE